MSVGRPPEVNRNYDRPKGENQIIEALEEEEYTRSELVDKVKISQGQVTKSVKSLEEKGEVEKYYSKERGDTLIRLSEEMTTPIEKTLRHLDKITVRPLLDLEKGRELLSEDAIKFILSLQSLKWVEKPSIREYRKSIVEVELEGTTKGWIINDPETVEKSVKELDFTEYDLLRGLAPYYFETRFVKYHKVGGEELYETFNEHWRDPVEKRLVEEMELLTIRQILDKKKENGDFEYPFFEKSLEKFYEEKGDNPIFFPVKHICEEGGYRGEMEQLLKWLEPLLSAEITDVDESETLTFSDLDLSKDTSDNQNKESYESKSYEEMIEEYEKYDIPYGMPDPFLGNADNLAAIVFQEETNFHANKKLSPVWRDYFSEKTKEEV